MKQINDTTFISDNLGELKPLVTIGGKPVDKFIPNLNISFHDDELFINLNRRDKQATSATDKAEIDGIDKDIFYIDENGRFKWDIEFKERPSKNSWTWELKHTDGIEFYYQGELTPKEIADGCERPLEVVGSYAVYCNKANNKYKTGKLCHIYRPFCYDINGESIYADLLIADGQLTIAIDETWLNNAVYPVRLDPTMGYDSVGASNTYWQGQPAIGSFNNSIVASSGDTVTELTVYHSTGDTHNLINLGIYEITNGSFGSLAGSGNFYMTYALMWESASVDISLSAGTEYGIAVALDGLVYNILLYFDTGTGTQSTFNSSTGLTDPWSSASTHAYIWSLYAKYTESGGGSLPSIINNYRQQGVM